MFESLMPSPESVARMDAMYERRHPTPTVMSTALVDDLRAAGRAENIAAGRRLAVVGELDKLRLRLLGERETWCTDTQDGVAAEIAAALNISHSLATSYLYYARAMRLRLPRVGALLQAGDLDYRSFQTIVYRTDLITDPDVIVAVDATLAGKAQHWPAMTRGALGAAVDRVVARADRDAVRRRRELQAERELSMVDDGHGLTEIFGRLLTPDAHALDARLDALAGTVCADDPRTRNQRRADSMAALTSGAERLLCLCGRPDCPAIGGPLPTPVVIHVVADLATVEGRGSSPGSMLNSDSLIPADQIAELARSAKLRPLVHPGDAPPEKRYVPSQALADFVRCRDLTCRFPGCDRPAVRCDVDHTVAHADGGPTHASNLKCLCRLHHLIKTFWGWSDRQLPDGTVVWTSPTRHTYMTDPGSAMLFPQFCSPTGILDVAASKPRCGDRAAMMPKRRRTRAQNRARYVADQRRHNRRVRQAHRANDPPVTANNDEPPPF
ncbi:HNH endonuclease signature motif containing protein [Candidatus Mycobacterium wuenschmannii]